MAYKPAYDAIHMYLSEVTSHVVAKSGIPTDRYHLGKIILHCIQDDPDFVMQIDGATGQSETNGSVLNRSVRCAIAFQKLGLQKGDIMILTGPNHVDLCIPLYAALYLGIIVACIDQTLGVDELKSGFKITQPKIIFCQSEKSGDMERALEGVGLQAKIVVFNEGNAHCTLAQFTENINESAVQDFRPTDFNSEETLAYLISTSGTTGLPKYAIATHKNLFLGIPFVWMVVGPKFPIPTKMALLASPIQWLTASFNYLFSPILKVTRLQTSASLTPEFFAHLVNKYKPTCTMMSPLLLQSMLPIGNNCDLTCFDCILVGGSAIDFDFIEKVKDLAKTQNVHLLYGLSEICSLAFQNDYTPPKGSSGKARGHLEYRLVDPNTKEDITEANVPGELWLRGPSVFKGYYKDPELTAQTLTEDGWLKSGDILYRDEYWHFYFVERLKSLLKYLGHQISPAEVEAVIKRHPAVLDVCVTGIPDKECGDLVVACVVPKPGSSPTAQEIKDIVKESLADSKQLRGGVIFLNELPTTNGTKINRKKLQEIALTTYRE